MSSHSPIPLFAQEESNTGSNIFLNSTDNNSLALPPLPQYIRLLLQNGYGIDSDRNLALLESLLQTRNVVVTDRKQYLRLYRVWSVLQRMESSGLRQLPYSDSVVSQEDEVACALHYKTGAPIFFSSQRRLLRQITGWLSDISAESLDESEGDQESIDQNEDEEDDASRTSSSDDFFQNQMLNSNRSHAQPAPPKLHPTKQQGQEALEQLLEKLVLRGEIERSAALALWHGYADHCVSLLCRAASQLRLSASKLATLSQEGVLEREEMADVYDLVAACVAGFQVKEECRSVIPHVQNEIKDKTPSALTAGANVANSSTMTSEGNATNKSDTNTTDSGHKSSSVSEPEHEESRWSQTCNRLLIRLSRLHQQRCSSYPAQNSGHTYSAVTKNTNNDTCQNTNVVLFQYEEESIAYLTAICRFLLANERSDIRTKRSEAYSHFLYNTAAPSSVETNNVGRDSGNAYYSKRTGNGTSKSFPVARICVTDTLAFAATYLDFQALRSTVTQLLWRRDTAGTLPVDIERICVSSGVVGVSQGVSLLVSHLRQSGDTATPALLLSRCITDSETYLTAPLHLPHTQSSLMLNSSVNNNNTAATLQSMSVAQRRLQQQQENVLWLKKLAAACVQLLRLSLHRIYSEASSPISSDRQWALLCRGRLDRDIAKRLQESIATQQQQQQQVSQLPPNTSSTTPLSASASVASNFYSSRFNNSNTNINASLTPAPIITSGLALLHKELWEALNRRTSMALAVGDHSVLQHSLFGNTASSHNKGYHSNSDLLTAAATSTAQYSHNGFGQSSQHNNSTTNGMSEQQREETTAWMLCQQLTAAVLRFSISNSRNNIANSSNVNASLPLDTHLGVCASALLCRVCRRPISTSKSNTGAHLLGASNGELSPAITGLPVGDVSVGNTPSVPTTTSVAQGSVEAKDDTLNNSHNELQEEELLLVGLCLHCRASLPACFVCDLPLGMRRAQNCNRNKCVSKSGGDLCLSVSLCLRCGHGGHPDCLRRLRRFSQVPISQQCPDRKRSGRSAAEGVLLGPGCNENDADLCPADNHSDCSIYGNRRNHHRFGYRMRKTKNYDQTKEVGYDNAISCEDSDSDYSSSQSNSAMEDFGSDNSVDDLDNFENDHDELDSSSSENSDWSDNSNSDENNDLSSEIRRTKKFGKNNRRVRNRQRSVSTQQTLFSGQIYSNHQTSTAGYVLTRPRRCGVAGCSCVCSYFA